MLSVNGIEVIYNHVILVLKGVSLTVREGGIVALLGANGAGKTTTLRAISNLLKGERGEVTKGYIEYMGERIERLTPPDLVKRGVVQVMEGGTASRTCRWRKTCSPAPTRAAAPRPRRAWNASTDISAPQGAAPLAVRLHLRRRAADDRDRPRADGAPKMILLDEPSMGLAPQLVEEIFEIVKDSTRRKR
jgi:branched-chain amino acid transport system ATP-binding protein